MACVNLKIRPLLNPMKPHPVLVWVLWDPGVKRIDKLRGNHIKMATILVKSSRTRNRALGCSIKNLG